MSEAKDFKLLIAGGGTGGHLYSGIAVAERLRESHPKAKVLFVGTPYGLEKEIVPLNGFELRTLQVSPLKGSSWKVRLKSLANLPRAYFAAKKILREFKPNFVLGIGGYASGPMTLAAHFAKIPTGIIEQNSIPGFTNRKLGRFVDKIFLSFSKAEQYFNPKKTLLSGNPTRKLSLAAQGEKRPGKFCLFVLGGSQGAHALNQAMLEAIPLLKGLHEKLYVIHQTGPQDETELRLAYQSHEIEAKVFAFDQNLGPYYSQADLMLCRSGAGTITELQNLGIPAILVPYPFAADDHQFFNAQEMLDAGAAELIRNQDLNGAVLAERLQKLVSSPDLLRGMREKAHSLAKPEAAEQVLQVCLSSS